MSNPLLNQAWRTPCETHAEKLVLLRLADFANSEGECWPNHATIAAHAGLRDRSVRNAITALKSAGHITITPKSRRAGHGAARFVYQVHPVTPEAASPVTPESRSGVRSDTGKAFPCDTGTPRHPHRKLTTSTPENDDNPVYRTPKNPQEPLRQSSSTSADGFTLELDSKKTKKPAEARGRDLIFETIAKLHGGHVGLTNSMRGAVNRAVKEIRESCNETGTPFTVDEIQRRIEHLKQKFPDLRNAWTSPCLAKEWNSLGTPPPPKVNSHSIRAQIEEIERTLADHPGNPQGRNYDPGRVSNEQIDDFSRRRDELAKAKGVKP